MQEFSLESDSAELKNLVRGNLVGVLTPNEQEGRRKNPVGVPFWYYRGVVEHHHRDGTLTVRIHDDGGRTCPQTLRFTTFHAKYSTPLYCEHYALVPWTEALERQIKIQKLSYLCWAIGSQWTYLSEQELDETLTLTSAVFRRYIDSDKGTYKEIAGKLGHVLSVHKRAALEITGWRYEVTITNAAEGSGVLRIYTMLEEDFSLVLTMRIPVRERFFSSPEECSRQLAAIGDPLPPVPPDALWSATRY